MADLQNSSNEEKKVAVETTETLKELVKPAITEALHTDVNQLKQPVIEKKEDTSVKQTPIEDIVVETENIKEELEQISNKEGFTNSFGRQDEFVELNSSGSISSGFLKRSSAQELGGLGCILKSEIIVNGVHSEALVFVPGASIIDLYENHEYPKEISGRTLAKR